MEAGLEHLSWAGGTLRHVDLALVVVEAQAKVLMTAERILSLAGQLGIPTALVGNRVRPGDRTRLEAFAREHRCELLGCIPDDHALRHADRLGVCPLDSAPAAIAVRAIDDLAAALANRFLNQVPRRPLGP